MLVIGVVGGIASGKSLVAEGLKDCGAEVLDADRAAHEVLGEEEVQQAIHERWGETVFTPGGEVDRSRVAQIVFAPANSAELEFLERLTHPRVKRLLERRMDEMSRRGARAAVLDAPLLLRAGWERLCDKVLYVDAPREMRLARALERGWTAEEFARREAAQEPLEWKQSHADVVIDNSGSPDSCQRQIEQFWQNLNQES